MINYTKMIRQSFLMLVFVFTFFFFVPQKNVSAAFSDEAAEEIGLKLTLGHLELIQTEVGSYATQIDEVEKNIEYSKNILKNNATLYGKLAYKVEVSSTTEANFSLMMKVNDDIIEVNKNMSSYVSLGDVVLAPGEEVEVTNFINLSTLPKADSNIDVKVTFLLLQTNAETYTETMFYDKTSTRKSLTLKAKEIEVEPPKEDSGWPEKGDSRWVVFNDERFDGRYLNYNFSETSFYGDPSGLEEITPVLNNRKIYLEMRKDFKFSTHQFSIDGYDMKINKISDTKYLIEYSLLKNHIQTLLVYAINPTLEFSYVYSHNKSWGGFVTVFNSRVNARRIILNNDINTHKEFKVNEIEMKNSRKTVQLGTIDIDDHSYHVNGTYGVFKPLSKAYSVKTTLTSSTNQTHPFIANIEGMTINLSLDPEFNFEAGQVYTAELQIDVMNGDEKITLIRDVKYEHPQAETKSMQVQSLIEEPMEANIELPEEPVEEVIEEPLTEEPTEKSETIKSTSVELEQVIPAEEIKVEIVEEIEEDTEETR